MSTTREPGHGRGLADAQEDADCLDFGYWSEWDADGGAGGSQAYTVEAYFRGKDRHTNVASVEGTANYSGKAVGLYARQVYEGNTLLDDRSGRFTEQDRRRHRHLRHLCRHLHGGHDRRRGHTAGTWSGGFYGDDTAVDNVTPQPGSVAGEFTAGFHNGSVVGAFGARKQ